MTKEIRFSRACAASEQGSYIRLGFEVPAGIGRIEIAYRYPRRESEARPEGLSSRETAVVDLGLYDEKRELRGWSGSGRTEAFVSEREATPGYRTGPIRAGEWSLALGLYRIYGEVEVQATVRLVDEEELLLAGDLHMHTLNSDGAYATAEVIAQCRAAGLDFIALTDHNNAAANEEIGRPEGILVLPGMEYTNYRGHANFFFRGDSDFREDPLSNSREEMLALFDAARERGALISINHPFCDLCPWEFGFEGLGFDMVEIWNGPMKPSELQAIAWWHGALAAGARIPGIGGSDMHRHEAFRSYGSPTSFVKTASASRPAVLDALLAGRASLSAARSGPRLDLRIGDGGLGGEAAASGPLEGRVSVASAREGDLVKVLDGRGRERSWASPFEGDLELPFDAEPDAVFFRAELWRSVPFLEEKVLFALTNPVYISRA